MFSLESRVGKKSIKLLEQAKDWLDLSACELDREVFRWLREVEKWEKLCLKLKGKSFSSKIGEEDYSLYPARVLSKKIVELWKKTGTHPTS